MNPTNIDPFAQVEAAITSGGPPGSDATGSLPSGIYCIACLPSRKLYVGQSLNIRRRWRGHTCRLTSGRHNNPHLQAAWNLYGAGAFAFTILEPCPPAALDHRESFWVASLRTLDREFGYNLRLGGRQGGALSAETRAKISAATKGRKNASPSAETRAKLSAALKGRKNGPRSPETKAKLSRLHRGRVFGPRSAETKLKISMAQKGRAGRAQSAEVRAKISAALKRLPPKSEETRRRSSQAQKGRPGISPSAATRAKLSEAVRKFRLKVKLSSIDGPSTANTPGPTA